MSSIKTLLITGATGFLGSHLVRRFLADGYKVAIIKRSTSRIERISDLTPQLYMFDADEYPVSIPFRQLGQVNVIIHTATNYGRHGEPVSKIFDSNTSFPLLLLEEAALGGVTAFLNTDTVLAKALNPYSLSKYQFKEWGKHFAESGKIRFINARLEHMYGPGDDESKFTTHVMRSCLRRDNSLKFTPGDQLRDFVHVADVVEAYKFLVSRVETFPEGFQDYDIGTGETTSIRDFAESVKHLTGSPTRLDFGALPYRENEVMYSCAAPTKLFALGWACRKGFSERLAETLATERQLIDGGTICAGRKKKNHVTSLHGLRT